MSKKKLIVLEGACDGIGKSTQLKLLRERLSKDNVEVSTHHFPTYNTYQGEPVTRYLKGEIGSFQELSPYFINSLYAIDRGITWHTELKHLYEKGNLILLDRYTTSSLLYQAAQIDDIEEKKKFIDFVIDFEYNKIGIKKPDNVIFLHAPFDLVTKMRNERKDNDGVDNDIYEKDIEFMRKVYENALFVADYLNWDKVKCNDKDSMRTIEDIHEDIYRIVKK